MQLTVLSPEWEQNSASQQDDRGPWEETKLEGENNFRGFDRNMGFDVKSARSLITALSRPTN